MLMVPFSASLSRNDPVFGICSTVSMFQDADEYLCVIDEHSIAKRSRNNEDNVEEMRTERRALYLDKTRGEWQSLEIKIGRQPRLLAIVQMHVVLGTS